MNVIDHIGLSVSDYRRALGFYQAALAPLGMSIVMRLNPEETGGYEGAGLGRGGKPSFWLSPGGGTAPPVHVAFVADDRGRRRCFPCGRSRRRRHRQRPARNPRALPSDLLRRLRARPGRQ